MTHFVEKCVEGLKKLEKCVDNYVWRNVTQFLEKCVEDQRDGEMRGRVNTSFFWCFFGEMRFQGFVNFQTRKSAQNLRTEFGRFRPFFAPKKKIGHLLKTLQEENVHNNSLMGLKVWWSWGSGKKKSKSQQVGRFFENRPPTWRLPGANLGLILRFWNFFTSFSQLSLGSFLKEFPKKIETPPPPITHTHPIPHTPNPSHPPDFMG